MGNFSFCSLQVQTCLGTSDPCSVDPQHRKSSLPGPTGVAPELEKTGRAKKYYEVVVNLMVLVGLVVEARM